MKNEGIFNVDGCDILASDGGFLHRWRSAIDFYCMEGR